MKLESRQPRDFSPESRGQTLPTRVIEQSPNLNQCRLDISGIGPPAWSSFLLLADRGWMGQFADQHFPIQPRALARFIQQPRLGLLIRVPVFVPNAFEVLLP